MAAELALDGSVRAVPGAIAMAERAGELGFEKIVVARASAAEAAMPAALGAHPCRVVPIDCLARPDATSGRPASRRTRRRTSSRPTRRRSSASTSTSFAASPPFAERSRRSPPAGTGC